MKKFKIIVCTGLMLTLVSCMTTTKVKPVNKNLLQSANTVCLESNPRVFHKDLLESAIVEAFGKQSIKLKTIQRSSDVDCDYKVTYVARRSWGFGVYISDISLNLFDKNHTPVGNSKWKVNSSLSPNRFTDLQDNVDAIVGKMISASE